jgi:para-aminobenzoate synthetase component 1
LILGPLGEPKERSGIAYMLPRVIELPVSFDKLTCFDRLAQLPHCLFLESVTTADARGRYSFLAADPFEFLTLPPGEPNVARRLEDQLAPFATAGIASLPPFQGGAAGLIGYDLNQSLELIATPRLDPLKIPAVAVGIYDVVVAFDHATDQQWLISQGFPEIEENARSERADRRAEFFLGVLTDGSATRPLTTGTHSDATLGESNFAPETFVPIDRSDIPRGVMSNFSRSQYLQSVRRVVDYIRAGDAFQVNLAQQLFYPANTDSRTLYHRLRTRNPAPFAGYFDIDGTRQIVSASPERFLRVAGGRVEARPIKGTRRRQPLPEADLYAGQELKDSEKDRAENIMILDLLRNDLSRVCIPESVRVTQLCDLETYEFVLHLVSAVEGVLRSDRNIFDLLSGAFPGGSITGAPKVRAMEIIQELEPHARGAYCGSLGYLGFDGSLDLSILIRTITAVGDCWQIPVGGGIVIQSTPESEYEETWHKAHGMLKAVVP